MKHLAVALIVLGLIAADFGASIWLHASDRHDWAGADTIALILAGIWFFYHRGGDA